MPQPPARYRGRFAPSPTGPLHFGSLVAAAASYVDARAAGGEWLVRMEDLDRPREQPGAARSILAALAALGLEPDGEVLFQSRREGAYRQALARLAAAGATYPCGCTRKELADSALAAPDGSLVYPGTCRDGLAPGKLARAVRVRVGDAVVAFDDAVQGRIVSDLARDVGDFVVLRADGLFAYQLAVVVDDAEQGITDVVRGADLLDSTPRQIFLQRLLGLPTPRYAHVPVALNARGEKLSKQTLAAPVDLTRPATALVAALAFLGQGPPAGLARAEPRTVLDWAVAHWSRAAIPHARALAAPEL
ncbi:MAG: tRNA glutamyl-Q(34) synthetase GluQRS [Burkholderiales bacterium]|nr:tRNA glutamyl-Q(34) synthetase GluQRS [Burkholderiales bacterium]